MVDDGLGWEGEDAFVAAGVDVGRVGVRPEEGGAGFQRLQFGEKLIEGERVDLDFFDLFEAVGAGEEGELPCVCIAILPTVEFIAFEGGAGDGI